MLSEILVILSLQSISGNTCYFVTSFNRRKQVRNVNLQLSLLLECLKRENKRGKVNFAVIFYRSRFGLRQSQSRGRWRSE